MKEQTQKLGRSILFSLFFKLRLLLGSKAEAAHELCESIYY